MDFEGFENRGIEVISSLEMEGEQIFKVPFAWKFAIDIGHENMRFFFYPDKKIASIPSYAATNGRKFFRGYEAKSIIGRGPSDLQVIPLIEDNTIKDYKILYSYLESILKDYVSFRLPISLLVGEMGKVKKVDLKFLYKIFKQLGFWNVYFVPQIIATAIGLGLDITKPKGYLILDIGAGTTKIGLVTLYGISTFKEIDSAGREMDRRIAEVLTRDLNLSIGPRTAEELKKKALDLEYLIDYHKPEEYVLVKGTDVMSKLPVEREVPKSLIAKAVEPTLYSILEELKDAMGSVSPELISDVLREGIYLTGGGSLIPNIEKYFSYKLNIRINNSRTNQATIKGLGEILTTNLFKNVSNLREAKGMFQKIQV